MKLFKLILVLTAALATVFIFALACGGSSLGIKQAFTVLIEGRSADIASDIIWTIRLPRIFTGMLVGAALAVCGAVLQGILKNPLAEPYTLGISGGAALGASVAAVFKFTFWGIPAMACAGSIISVFLVYLVALKKRFSNSALVLGGVVLSYIFSSAVLMLFAAAKSSDVHHVVLWLIGDLSSADYTFLRIIAVFVVPSTIALIALGRRLDVLAMGQEKAQSLGVDAAASKKTVFVLVSVITGACVAASGMIGFVGLMIPHTVRRLCGPGHRMLLTVSCFAGAGFLIFCDALARIMLRPVELPVGVVTGIFGGLFFLWLLFKKDEWEMF